VLVEMLENFRTVELPHSVLKTDPQNEGGAFINRYLKRIPGMGFFPAGLEPANNCLVYQSFGFDVFNDEIIF